MNAKFILIAITALAVSSVSAIAGGGKIVSYDKNPISSKNPLSAPLCYDAGFEFGIYGAGFLPQGGGSEHEEGFKEAFGGGVSLGYFFNENIGLDLGAAVYGTSSEVQNYTLDLVYRLPNQDACFAPYAFVGGGLHANGANEGLVRGGVGIDYKIAEATSVFADGAYSWVGGSVEEYITVRAGVRFSF